jgi:hypothetical protein
MGLVERVQRWIRGGEPTLVDYDSYQQLGLMGQPQNAPVENTDPAVVGKVGPAGAGPASAPAPLATSAGTYKIQQSYDALLQTVQDLRATLDGQARRQEELFNRLSTLPLAAEALPQTTKMQSDMLKLINDRLAMHADQHRKATEVINALGGGAPSRTGISGAKKESTEALRAIREQIETGNEIDRQLVESFNRFSMMIDRLQLANQHAVSALQQVRDSYAASAMQMHEWIEKSRHRGSWILAVAFLFSAGAMLIAIVTAMRMAGK